MHDDKPIERSGAAAWPLLRPFIDAEARIAARMSRRPATAALYEFLRFGMKQAWACLFGGLMIALLLGTYFFYPSDAALARYDFLFLAALALQVFLLGFGLETFEEGKVIAAYHVVGTAMEIFKTAVGSWVYPEDCFFRIAGVPLFSGFMLVALSVAIYVNFFTHHYLPDMRWALFLAAALLFARTRIYFVNWETPRWMPLLLGLLLVTAFIWVAENVGTFTRTWIYPNQRSAWSLVGAGKFGSWFLLLIISYTLVALIKKPAERIIPAPEPEPEPREAPIEAPRTANA